MSSKEKEQPETPEDPRSPTEPDTDDTDAEEPDAEEPWLTTASGRVVQPGWHPLPTALLPTVQVDGLTHPHDARLLAQFCDYLATHRTRAGGTLAGALFRGVAQSLYQWAEQTEDNHDLAVAALAIQLDTVKRPRFDAAPV